MKKALSLILALTLILSLTACGEDKPAEDNGTTTTPEATTTTPEAETPEPDVDDTPEPPVSDEKPSPEDLWRTFISNLEADKIAFYDVNDDGISELIYVDSVSTTIAFYTDLLEEGYIMIYASNQFWGDGCESGGMPMYLNQETKEIMTVSIKTDSVKYNVIYTLDVYIPSPVYERNEQIVAMSVEEMIERDLYEDILEEAGDDSEESLKRAAMGLGYYDRVDVFTVDGEEIPEEDWEKAVEDFKNNSILLCPCNSELNFIDISDFL